MRAEGGCSLCGANRKPRPSETPDSWWQRGLGFPPRQASQPTGRKGPRTGEADPDLRLDSTPARVTDYPKLEILVIVLICAHRWKFSTLVLPTRLELILSSPPSNVCPDCLARTAAGGDSCAVHPRAPHPHPQVWLLQRHASEFLRVLNTGQNTVSMAHLSAHKAKVTIV